jgi:ribosome-associated protein
MTRDLSSEVVFKASRSTGPGGQNVNKVNTKVELRFDVLQSKILLDEEKQRILQKLKNRINKEGVLVLASDQSRSQLKNKILVLELFHELIRQALIVKKKRKSIKISLAAKKKRLESKQRQSEKKVLRKPPNL